MEIMIGDHPLHCLTMMDDGCQKITLVTLGQQDQMVQKMREISEVLFVAGNLVEQDMSNAMTGYPMIVHTGLTLQVIPWQEFLQGAEACQGTGHMATGAHLER